MLVNFMLDVHGRVRDWNPRAQAMFGYTPDEARGKPYSQLVDAPGLIEGASQHPLQQDCRGVRADGSTMDTTVLATPLLEGGRVTGYSLVVRDLAQADAPRRDELADKLRLMSIVESAMDAIITIDEDQNIVLFNGAAEKVFGCPAAQALGGPLDRFLPPQHRADHRAHVARFAKTGTTSRRMGDQTVLTGMRADGSEFPLEASISQARVGERRLFSVILRDITERHQAAAELEQSHRQLQRLYASMHDVREAERTRIARELHDELAQWLTALKMDASWIAQRIDPRETQIAAKIARMKTAMDTTVASVRRIAADLRPVMLDDLGLVAALDNLLNDFSERTGIIATLKAGAEEMRFGDPVSSAVYRMVQEAVTNVGRHAQAKTISVDAASDGERVTIRVRDDGRGIAAEDLASRDSYGLLGIRERAQTLGGTARIYSPPEGGTVVDIDIPLVRRDTGAR